MRIGINTLGIIPGFGGGEELFLRKVIAEITSMQSNAELVLLTDMVNNDSFADYTCVQIKSPKEINSVCAKQDIDIVFSGADTAPAKLSVPLVLWVMNLYQSDTQPQKKSFWGKSQSTGGNFEDACQRADIVVVPSEFMKKELLRLYTVPLNKVVVAPLGVDEAFAKPESCIVQQPYFLAVGKVSPRKNLDALMQAFRRIENEIPHSLVIVGQPDENEPDHWGDRVFRIDRLGNTQLAGLYQHCDMYVCPSLYEGSGITVLEAFKAGALVGCGRIGGIQEVAGDTPFYFNAESIDSITGVLKRALDEPEDARARRASGGKLLTQEYTWENCAWKTLTAFRKAITTE